MNNKYWRERELKQLAKNKKEEAFIENKIQRKYNVMIKNIESEIHAFYTRYALKENITLAEAQRRVSAFDVAQFSVKAQEYVKERNFSKKANEQLRLYNATMRINRLELLKANIGLQMIATFDEIDTILNDILDKRTSDEIKRQIKQIKEQAGILEGSDINILDTTRNIVEASFHNATFSERIWGNQAQLKYTLDSLLTSGFIQGLGAMELSSRLRKEYLVSKRNADRLMRTELARVQTEAQRYTYDNYGYDQYMFIATEDLKTCDTCSSLNGKIFDTKDMEIGVNAPPIHPNDRCSTAPYMFRSKDEIMKEAREKLVGIETPFGKVETIADHFANKVLERNTNIDRVIKSMKEPLKITDIKIDKKNRPSVNIIGKEETVAYNPETNQIITVHNTHTKLRSKLENENKSK